MRPRSLQGGWVSARPRWHIDYLLPHGEITAVVAAVTGRRVECRLAAFMAGQFRTMRRFGSSDCRCAGHLFHGGDRVDLLRALLDAVRSVDCRPKVISVAGPVTSV